MQQYSKENKEKRYLHLNNTRGVCKLIFSSHTYTLLRRAWLQVASATQHTCLLLPASQPKPGIESSGPEGISLLNLFVMNAMRGRGVCTHGVRDVHTHTAFNQIADKKINT